MSYFDDIQLSNEQINEIVEFIEADEIEQYEAAKLAQYQLNQKLNLTQERISKLIDMHIDGKIDAQTYHFKLEEYKREQQALILEIKSYDSGSKAELVAAKEVLDLAKNAKETFMSSKLDEKQQLLRLFFSNLSLDNEKLDVELREPFNSIAKLQDQTIWRYLCDAFRSGEVRLDFSLGHIQRVFMELGIDFKSY